MAGFESLRSGRRLTRVWLVVSALCCGGVSGAQGVDRSEPPVLAEAAEGFIVRRLAELPVVDQRAWRVVQPITEAGPARAANGQFAITLEEATSGDVVHFRVVFAEDGGRQVELDPGTTYAFVTSDSRWIVTSPLDVIDVRNWRRHSLSRTSAIAPYVVVRAVSSDGRRLLISRQECPFDCPDLPQTFYEVELPE
jgi:hypothetical protein